MPVFVHDRAGAAWFDRGTARVTFDLRVSGGVVTHIDLLAEPDALDAIRRQRDGALRCTARRARR